MLFGLFKFKGETNFLITNYSFLVTKNNYNFYTRPFSSSRHTTANVKILQTRNELLPHAAFSG